MKSLGLFLLSIVLAVVAYQTFVNTDRFEIGLLAAAGSGVIFLIALVVNHAEHMRR